MKRTSTGTILFSVLFAALAASLGSVACAQAPISENFTGATTANSWYFFNGACLTAGTSTSSTSPGTVPACTSVLQSYYSQQEDHDAALVGGVDGYLGSSTAPASTSAAVADPVGQGALRFTNGYPYGNGENGTILSASTFPTGEGIRIQFMTVTYHGDSGGNSAGCPSGSTASGGECVVTNTVAATASYSCQSGYTLSGNECVRSGHTDKTPTTTYSCPSGYTLSGTNCIEITSVVLESDPQQNDGADGISFFLMDGSQPVTFDDGTVGNYGSWGGSLGYSCSNTNGPYNGMVGAYVGLGIDEYGNFLNGTQNTLGVTDPQALGDNTASGGGQWANRIGLRGSGNVSWYWLNANYPTYYPSTLTTTQQEGAVQNTCETGTLWNYSTSTSHPTNTGATSANGGPVLYDYYAIPNAYSVLPGVQIANESATTRAQATPITYDLQITQDGLLSLSYSVNGGATQEVIQNQSITSYNGPLPSSFRFGFAGSTGGSTNIHEILCFQAQPNSVSQSSAGVNQKLSAQIQTGAYAYFAYFDPDDWAGRVTADALGTDSSGNLIIYTTPTWDASCVLTGGSCASTGATNTAESPSSRVILTWNGTTGIPFEWSSLTTAQQSALDSTDSTETANRLNYLRGDTSNDVNSNATCTAASSGLPCLRDRASILGDIIDSSPTWVGPPSAPYGATFSDRLYSSAAAAENATGAQTYPAFISAEETRENVVYVGANDGLLHGFRSGADTSTGVFDTTAPNDGEEVLAYMPGAVISGAVLTTGSASTPVVDTIHGTDPTKANAVTTDLDFSNTQYGHNYTVDATPGTGDLFYQGAWHTWLVGGLGPGGAAIYALDITNPTDVSSSENNSDNFSETDAANIVMGEWTAASISCSNVANCGLDLGDTYGTPVIRRTHAENGSGENEWAVIWGNGFGSSSGDAGIFVMTIDPATGAQTTYYLSTGTVTGTAGTADETNNGIAYVTPADLDGDHTTDYVYAGDLYGNVWRFDLTSSNPTNWSTTRCLDAGCTTSTTAPLFTATSSTGTVQPITSQLALAVGQTAAGAETLIITFGTGHKSPFTNTGAATYQSGTQSLYGVWDWAMANWNAHGSTQYAALQPGTPPVTITPASLQQQAITVNSTNGDRDITASATVCWEGTSACTSGDDQFGWYLSLPGTSAQGSEQIIYNPQLVGNIFVINSTLPPNSTQLSCNPLTETGYTYAVSALSGGAESNIFPQYYDTSAAGVLTNATGTVWEVTTSNNSHDLVYQTTSSSSTSDSSGSSGSGSTTGSGTTTNTGYQECSASGTSNCTQFNPPGSSGHRLTWIELR
jgi:type IV pilus assembly protein PilY1